MTINERYDFSKNPTIIKLVELSCQVDSDKMTGFEQCPQCNGGIDDEQTFYFWNKEKDYKAFCHPSCVELYYLIKWIEKQHKDDELFKIGLKP